jgi:uncharacterized membrane protein
MAVFYVSAGINHFVSPAMYMAIMPPWLPAPLTLVYLSGVAEIMAGLLLLPAATRRMGAWMVILLLIAVFPANVQMSVNYHREHNPLFWVTLLRLPLQFVLIWWAWTFAKKKGG